LGKGYIPHQVDAKMDYMNITAASSAGSHNREPVNSNTVHHVYDTQLENRSSAWSNGKTPMSPDNTFDGWAAGRSKRHTSGGGAPALDCRGQAPNLKRGSLSTSYSRQPISGDEKKYYAGMNASACISTQHRMSLAQSTYCPARRTRKQTACVCRVSVQQHRFCSVTLSILV